MTQNLSSYWIFYTVANAGNISKAAKELYISQPAISKSIQKLEESLNCKLFSRSSRGVILTDEGTLLYDHVKEAFETLSMRVACSKTSSFSIPRAARLERYSGVATKVSSISER